MGATFKPPVKVTTNATLVNGKIESELSVANSSKLNNKSESELSVDNSEKWDSFTLPSSTGNTGKSLTLSSESTFTFQEFATHDHIHDNATSSESGFLPILDNTGTKYLRDDGTWQTIPGGLELGETQTTAYRGDRGKTAYDHSQSTHAPTTAITASGVTYENLSANGDVGTGATQVSQGDHQHTSTQIPVTYKSGSTYTTLQDWINGIQSSGRISGGVITAHSPTDGTVDITALTGFIKLTDNTVASTEFFNLGASTGIALTDNQTNYIYVTYNAGNPQIAVTTDRSTIRQTDQFTLGRAFRNGTDVEVLTSGINLYNRSRLIHEKWIDTFGGVSYASGLIVSCTGLKPAFTSGILYAGSNKITVPALDCNVSGTFTTYYTTNNGSTWTVQTGQTTLNNTQYNDVNSGLATLSNNQYGVHWLYICPEGSLYVLYGKGSYTLSQAQAVAAPVSPIPNYLSQWAKLAAKIIILKSATAVYSITHAWSTQFPIQTPGDHNSLASLQGGATDQYYHLNSTVYNLVNEYSPSSFASSNHTHDLATSSSSGFLPILENTTTKYLRDDGTWQSAGISEAPQDDKIYGRYGNDSTWKSVQQLIVVESMTTTSPPTEPVDGELYLLPADCTGDWEYMGEGAIVYYNESTTSWKYYGEP